MLGRRGEVVGGKGWLGGRGGLGGQVRGETGRGVRRGRVSGGSGERQGVASGICLIDRPPPSMKELP